MNTQSSLEKIDFASSASAEAHLLKYLPEWVGTMSKQGIVPILSWCGGTKMEKGGKVLWEYTGPQFCVAGQKPEALSGGKYYDLLGCPVWIEEFSINVLKGHVLTTMKIGPEDNEILIIENAPADYLNQGFPECSCCNSKNSVKADD